MGRNGLLSKALPTTEALYEYTRSRTLVNENSVLQELLCVSQNHPQGRLLTEPCQVKLMCTMLQLMNAKRGIEGILE
jgi:hypothetical protein